MTPAKTNPGLSAPRFQVKHKADMNATTAPRIEISVRNLNFFYGKHHALFDNTIDVFANSVTAFIGPSGCGKSTHLRVYNRIYQLYPRHRAEGTVLLGGQNLLDRSVDLLDLRRRVGMVFQKPSPLPLS